MSAALSYTCSFDGTTTTRAVTWQGADSQHLVLFTTAPASGFAAVIPTLQSHTSTGATISVPPGWQGKVTVTLLQGLGSLWGLPIITAGRATFTASSWATLTWDDPLPDSGYIVIIGPPVVADGKGAVAVSADASNNVPTGMIVNATSAFSGYVDVLACQPGANPMLGAL